MSDISKRLFSIIVGVVWFSILIMGCTNIESNIALPTISVVTKTFTKSIKKPASGVTITPPVVLKIIPTNSPSPTQPVEPLPLPTSTEITGQEIINDTYFEVASVSPHGDWAAVVIGSRGQTIMRVFNQTQGWQRWDIYEQNHELLRFIPWPLTWSQDGKYLYYTHHFRNGDGCLGYWASNGRDLFKLDLTSGETTQLSPRIGNWLALSPDEKFLGFLDSGRIGILELENGQSRDAEIESNLDPSIMTHPLHMVWSPDGKNIIIGLLSNICVDEDSDKYSLIKINAMTFDQTVLVEESSEWLQPIEWLEPNRVLIRDESGKYWRLDPDTGKLEDER